MNRLTFYLLGSLMISGLTWGLILEEKVESDSEEIQRGLDTPEPDVVHEPWWQGQSQQSCVQFCVDNGQRVVHWRGPTINQPSFCECVY